MELLIAQRLDGSRIEDSHTLSERVSNLNLTDQSLTRARLSCHQDIFL